MFCEKEQDEYLVLSIQLIFFPHLYRVPFTSGKTISIVDLVNKGSFVADTNKDRRLYIATTVLPQEQ